MLDIFGGQEPFIKFMLRERPLDDGTIDAIVAAYDVERDLLDKPFCEPPGVQAIKMEGQETCKDPICCPPNRHNWREDLQETLAAVLEQRG